MKGLCGCLEAVVPAAEQGEWAEQILLASFSEKPARFNEEPKNSKLKVGQNQQHVCFHTTLHLLYMQCTVCLHTLWTRSGRTAAMCGGLMQHVPWAWARVKGAAGAKVWLPGWGALLPWCCAQFLHWSGSGYDQRSVCLECMSIWLCLTWNFYKML